MEEDFCEFKFFEDIEELERDLDLINFTPSEVLSEIPFKQRQTLLATNLSHRPTLSDLLSLNIIFPPHLAPSLHATARSLDFQRRLHHISQKVHLRPTHSSLLSSHILLHSPASAISPRLQAAQRTLEFSHLRGEISHRLENRPEVGLLADLNILPSALGKNQDLACGLLPTMQVLGFKISKCKVEAKLGGQHRTTFCFF